MWVRALPPNWNLFTESTLKICNRGGPTAVQLFRGLKLTTKNKKRQTPKPAVPGPRNHLHRVKDEAESPSYRFLTQLAFVVCQIRCSIIKSCKTFINLLAPAEEVFREIQQCDPSTKGEVLQKNENIFLKWKRNLWRISEFLYLKNYAIHAKWTQKHPQSQVASSQYNYLSGGPQSQCSATSEIW